MEEDGIEPKIVYTASRIYIVIFYGLLVLWTLVSVPLLAMKSSDLGILWIGMLSFVIVMTWYWSLHLVYRIELENGDTIRLKSFQEDSPIKLGDFRRIEGPPSGIAFGFIRLRTERASFYAFFCSASSLKQILAAIRRDNPGVHFIKFSSNYFANVKT